MRIWTERAHESSGSFLSRSKGKDEGRLDDKRALHNVFIFEDLAAGAEQGFILPTAGQDREWVEENMDKFEKRAAEGDESMRVMVEEAKAGFGKR